MSARAFAAVLTRRPRVGPALLTATLAAVVFGVPAAKAEAATVHPSPGSGTITDHYGNPDCCPYVTDIEVETTVAPTRIEPGQPFSGSSGKTDTITGNASFCDPNGTAPSHGENPVSEWTFVRVAPGSTSYNGTLESVTLPATGTETFDSTYGCDSSTTFRQIHEHRATFSVSGGATQGLTPGCYQPSYGGSGLSGNETGTLAVFAIGTDIASCAATSKCSDGQDNDGDGQADHPLDPGCSAPDDDSERGTNQCDNGLDDDGDGQADFGRDPQCWNIPDASEAAGCRRDRGQVGTIRPSYDGGYYGLNLFRFSGFARYCWDGVSSEVLFASALGVTNLGKHAIKETALELLGFTFEVVPPDPDVLTTGPTATLRGGFETHVDLIGVVTNAFGGAIARRMVDRFATAAEKGDPNAWLEAIRLGTRELHLAVVKQMIDVVEKLGRYLPDRIAYVIASEVWQKVKPALHRIDGLHTALGKELRYPGRLPEPDAKQAAERATENVNDFFQSRVLDFFTWKVPAWLPVITISTSPDGTATALLNYDGNPLISTELTPGNTEDDDVVVFAGETVAETVASRAAAATVARTTRRRLRTGMAIKTPAAPGTLEVTVIQRETIGRGARASASRSRVLARARKLVRRQGTTRLQLRPTSLGKRALARPGTTIAEIRVKVNPKRGPSARAKLITAFK